MATASWTQQQILAQLDSGSTWSGDTISYAFPTSSSGMYGYYESSGFTALNATQQGYARLALQLWDDLIAPDFVQTTASNSNIELAFSSTGVNYAHAYFPSTGSVWFNRYYNDLTNPEVGGDGFLTYVHELGHALGLEHMGNYNGSGNWTPSCYEDSTVYSVMSYFGPSWGSGSSSGIGQVAWADWIGADGVLYSPQTPMLNDIMALQSMYGAETTTRTGDTVYGFNSNVSGNTRDIYDFTLNLYPILTIYDAAGTDTLDLSGWTTDSIINLAPGSYSSCNSMTYNIAIAYNCDIENAIGGRGNDTITGNALANLLDGGSGNDILFGGAGSDRFIASLGNDSYDGGADYDTMIFNASWTSYSFSYGANGTLIFSSSTSGTDTLKNIEALQFTDGLRLVSDLGTATPLTARVAVSASNASIAEGNSGTQVVSFVVQLSQASAAAASINWALGGTATADDFSSPTSGTLSFLAGETQKTIQLLVNGDQTVEADESIVLSLSNPSANLEIATGSASTLLLNDDQALPLDDYSFSTDTSGRVTVDGTATKGVIETANDADLFAVTLVAGTRYEFTLNKVAGNLDTYLELYDGNLRLLADNDDASAYTLDSRLVFTAQSSGVHYLGAWGYSSSDIGSYEIKATSLDTGSTVPVNTIYGTASANSLTGTALADLIYGLAGNDTLYGNAGDDTLDGGTGNDKLLGGAGNDTYIVDSTRDTITETSGAGTDQVISSVNYTLANHVENLSLSGSAALNATGNTLANTLTGNSAANKLYGQGGNDILFGGDGADLLAGGQGNDTLFGEAGADLFRFDTALNASTNIDLIADFELGLDRIQLENSVFRKLTATGQLKATNFESNASGVALDAKDFIVYNNSTGALYYDADGNGKLAAVQFAQLDGTPELSIADFLIT